MHGRARVPLSLKKRFLFAVLMGALTYLAVELISFAAIGFLYGSPATRYGKLSKTAIRCWSAMLGT